MELFKSVHKFVSNDIYVVIINIVLFVGIITATCLLIASQHNVLIEEQKQQIKEFVYAGVRVADMYSELAAQGKMTVEDAKKQTVQVLSSLGYGDHHVVCICTPSGTVILHPQMPSGLRVMDDTYGKMAFPLLKARAMESFDGGFVKHQWPRPSTGKVDSKITFVRYYKNWDWIMSSGDFSVDVGSRFTTEVVRAIVAAILTGSLVGLMLFFVMFMAYVRRCPLCRYGATCKFISPNSKSTDELVPGDLPCMQHPLHKH